MQLRPWVEKGVGKPFNIVVLALILLTLWLFSTPGLPIVVVLLVYPWAALGVYWLLRLALMWNAAGSPLRRRLGAVVFAPIAVFVCLGLISFGVPAEVRFDLSQGAMTEFATDFVDDPATPVPDRIGLYEVLDVDRTPEGMLFFVGVSSYVYGFAYSPDAAPADRRFREYEHWEGPWYLVWEEF